MDKGFNVGGLSYVASLDSAGDFSFRLAGGNSPKGSARNRKSAAYDLYYDDRPVHSDVDLNYYALPVLKAAGDILVDMVYADKPWRVGFCASTARKVRIYGWLAKKLAKKLPGYRMVHYPDGCWSFYRND